MLMTLPEADDRILQSLGPAPAEGSVWEVQTTLPEAAPGPGQGEYRPPRIGRYAVLRQLGKGGFGIVYLAHDQDLDRPVAVKVPYVHRLGFPEQLQLYHAEARLHAALDHPHIVPIYDVGRTETIPFYLVSKFIPGQNLSERIKQARPAFRDTAALLVPLAEALAHMHGRGLVHRDIKPRNILLDDRGAPYLTDFGLAIRTARTEESDAEEGQIIGTPAYMSPEQARGEGDRVDGRTDIYSLGVVLYELLTGVRPFAGHVISLRDKIIHEVPRPPRQLDRNVPKELEAICLMAIARDPARRYQRAEDLAEDLRCFLRSEPLRYAGNVGVIGRGLAGLRRHRGAAVMAAVVLVALTLTGLMALWALSNRPPAPEGPPLRVTVAVETDPPGADLFYVPLDAQTGLPRPEDGTHSRAGVSEELLPGHYLVVAVLRGEQGPERFHEVFRYVPKNGNEMQEVHRPNRWDFIAGVIRLRSIRLPQSSVTAGMCYCRGATEFVLHGEELPGAGSHRRSVPPFYLDTTEVTIQDYLTVMPGFRYPRGAPMPLDHPVAFVSWLDAITYAEEIGKRLPDEVEYEWTATAGGRRKFPWGDAADLIREWKIGPVGTPAHDRLELDGQPPVLGLFSNAAEWTSSWYAIYPNVHGIVDYNAKLRVTRGGPTTPDEDPAPWQVGPSHRHSVPAPDWRPHLGFRCARSARPRLSPDDFGKILAK
jgi:hypothetical protein